MAKLKTPTPPPAAPTAAAPTTPTPPPAAPTAAAPTTPTPPPAAPTAAAPTTPTPPPDWRRTLAGGLIAVIVILFGAIAVSTVINSAQSDPPEEATVMAIEVDGHRANMSVDRQLLSGKDGAARRQADTMRADGFYTALDFASRSIVIDSLKEARAFEVELAQVNQGKGRVILYAATQPFTFEIENLGTWSIGAGEEVTLWLTPGVYVAKKNGVQGKLKVHAAPHTAIAKNGRRFERVWALESTD